MAFLTSRDLAQSTAITPTTLIHIVTTGDTSQGNVDGSSYKAELQQLLTIFGSSTFTGGTVTGPTTFTSGLTADTISATTLTINGVLITGDTNFANTDLTFNNPRTHTLGSQYLLIANDPSFATLSSFLYLANNELQLGNYSLSDGMFFEFSGNTAFMRSNAAYNITVYETNIGGSDSSFSVGQNNNSQVTFYVKSQNDNNLIASDPLNDRIGIGTNTPTEKFTVSGNTEITNNLLVGGDVLVQTDLAVSLNTIETQFSNSDLKGEVKYFAHSGKTGVFIFNSDSSGRSICSVGSDLTSGKATSLSYFNNSYVRPGLPNTGNNFYQNKGILDIGNNTNGLVINISPTGTTGNLWFEQNGDSIMYLKGNGTEGLLGIGLNSDGTELPSANLQVGGTGTTGSFKYKDGNEQNGYVLTSDNDGNATWQASTGGGLSVDPFYDSGSGSTITWNVSGQSTNYQATLTATTILNLTNVRNGDYGTIILTQDGTGGRTITLGTVNGAATTHKVANGGAGTIVLTSNANAEDILTFTYNGSRMYWTVGNDYT